MGRPTLLVAVAILIVFLWLFVPYNLLNQHLPGIADRRSRRSRRLPPYPARRLRQKTEKLSAKVEVPFRKEDGVITFRLSRSERKASDRLRL